MNLEKQHRKLHSLTVEADQCTNREEAQRIIRKADKTHNKLEFLSWMNSKKKTGQK
jgi:hypothetical protein